MKCGNAVNEFERSLACCVRMPGNCIGGKMRPSETLLDGYRHFAMLMSK